ncbi:MAG: dihydrofolate reductase [Bacteroidaceae bacterium]|nr:dihydrofolate reductase [Bacteroidaceae bacterium]
MVSIIVAIASNNAIGRNNELLYHMPNDMKRFKETTTGHTIIMGRKTFNSFPRRPLPNRRNIVLASENNIPDDKQGAEWMTSLPQALNESKNDGEVFIIGGASVYVQALSLADMIYLTIIDDEPQDADSFFPEIDYNEWKVESEEKFPADEKHAHPYSFINLVRK